jgi:hypothetical protein
MMSEAMKFFVNERYQFVTGSFISVASGNQQLGHIMTKGSHGITRRLGRTAESAADYTPSRRSRGAGRLRKGN